MISNSNVQNTRYSEINSHISNTIINPNFDDVYERLIKPIKDMILAQDSSATFQIEERSNKWILLKLTGTTLSADMLSHIDKNYEWDGKYYVYSFACDSINIIEDKHISYRYSTQ